MLPERVLSISYRQDDLITRRQALAAGATREFIRHAISPKGRWQRVLPGIYATFTGPLTPIHKYRAAILHCGRDAVITGTTACRMHGMDYVPEADGIDVLVPHTCHVRTVDFVRPRRTHRLPAPVYWLGLDVSDEDVAFLAADNERDTDELAPGAGRWQIPMAPLARAAVDAVRLHDMAIRDDSGELPASTRRKLLRDTRALLCEIVQRRRVREADLVAELGRSPRAHAAQARIALFDILAGCRSAPECELRDVIRRSTILPEPRWNRPLPGEPGLIPDACWPDARLVVEVDSKRWHRYGAGAERTERRQSRYAELGWRAIPVSPDRIRAEPKAVRQQIERAYLRGVSARAGRH